MNTLIFYIIDVNYWRSNSRLLWVEYYLSKSHAHMKSWNVILWIELFLLEDMFRLAPVPTNVILFGDVISLQM